MTTNKSIAFIIPCYNEARRLDVSAFSGYLEQKLSSISLVFVNDGSSDDTNKMLSGLVEKYPDNSSFINLPKNVGKAEAIRQGVLEILKKENTPDYIGFMDADLAVPLSEIQKIQDAISRFKEPSMIIGSRIKLFGSTNIERSNRRHYVGRIIATLISKSLKLPIYDTQCGFKAFKSERCAELFKESFTSRWLFDVELIFRLLILTSYSKINGELFEMPVSRWEEKGDSRIPLTYAFRMPFELLKINQRYKSKVRVD